MFFVNLSYCIYVDPVPSASNFTPSFTTLLCSLVFLFQQVSFYCPAISVHLALPPKHLWCTHVPIHLSSPIKCSTSSSLHPPSCSTWNNGEGVFIALMTTTESPAVLFTVHSLGKSSFCGWHFPENPSSVLAYLFLSSCLCDFGQFWAHTLLIPHLLHGKRPLSLLSLEFNARKELWANSEQEAQFPGSTAQFCKCTKKKQTDAQFSPSAYSLRLSGWFLQCLNHRSIRLFIRIEIIH